MYVDNPRDHPHGWLNIYSVVVNKPFEFDNDTGIVVRGTGPHHYELYVSALYYTLSSLTTCGFGNISPNTICEKVFGCITMLLGCKC